MGDWGAEPWSNDEAADWFHRFWKGGGISLVVSEINDFDTNRGSYDSFRAASYVLQAFGNPYMWPTDVRSDLNDLIDRSIHVLTYMIEPPSEDWEFLEMCENDQKVIASVRRQIEALERRRSDIAERRRSA